MPRILLILASLILRAGRGLRSLMDGLLLGTLYFVLLAPAAVRRKIFRPAGGRIHARGSSWFDTGNERKEGP